MQKLALRLLPLALLLFASAAAAQRSELRLQVTDGNGAELGPVQLTFTSPEGEVVEAKTAKNGRARIRLKRLEEPWMMLMQKEGLPDREVPVEMTGDRSLKIELWDEATKTKAEAVDSFNEGFKALQGGDAEGALPLFQKAVELDPGLADAYRIIAAILHGMGKPAEALEPLDKYLEVAELPPELAGLAFDVFLAAGDPRVEEAKQRAIEAGIGEEIAVSVFSQGVQAVNSGDKARALELFTETVSLNPKLYQAHRNIATIHFNNQDWEPTLEALTKTLELDPKNTEALRLRFFAYILQDQLAPSIEAGKAWIAVNPTAGRQVQHEAEKHFQNEAYGNAKTFDLSLIAWDDNHPRAHYRLGVSYRRSADSALSRKHLTTYLETAPEDDDLRPRAHYELGMLAVNANEADTAREHLNKFLDMAPEDEEADVTRAILEQLPR